MYTLGNPEKATPVPATGVPTNNEKIETKNSNSMDFSTSVEDVDFVETTPTTKTLFDDYPDEPASKKANIPEDALNLGGFGNFFGQAIENVIKQKAEALRPEVLNILKAELQKLKPTNIKIAGRNAIGVVEGYTHKLLKDAIFLCEQERQLMMVGPAGSGKTTLASQVSKAFKIPFYSISCSAGMSEAHLLGRMLFDGTYVPSDFITAYEKGGVFLFDEIDAADSNTLLVVNSALANGYVSVPNRKDNPRATRHEDFICVVAGNSWGNGTNTYQGRGYLDAAFLDRFSISKLEIEYDTVLESQLVGDQQEVLKRFHQIRDIVVKQRLKRIVSTRSIISAARQAAAGKSIAQIEKTFTTDWTPDEIKKIK
jgi:predicted ATPase with chaperone activity